MLYTQTTETQKYLASLNGLASSTVQANVGLYKRNRAAVLGLPLEQNGQQFLNSNLKLKDRLAALGGEFGVMMAANDQHKQFIEAQVAQAVAGLGGWDKVLPTGEWGFTLDDVTRDGDGKITGYKLPGLAYDVTTQTRVGVETYGVVITVNEQTGVGTATITPKAVGQTENTDPI